jgi:hypothetical protein
MEQRKQDIKNNQVGTLIPKQNANPIGRINQEKVLLKEEIRKVIQKEVQQNNNFEKTCTNIREKHIRGMQIF